MENYELYHHGIKGMRWGIRRTPEQLGQKVSRKEKKRIEAEQKAKAEQLAAARKARAERQKKLKAGKLSPKEMTPKELEAQIKRLELEKDYNDLIKDSKTASASLNRGKKFASKFADSFVDKLGDQSADVAVQLIKHYLVKSANKMAKEQVTFTNNKKK